ncbi:hypothetical protein GCM10009430_17880 [Aquimarina litoralis]|uniref:Uncharacterized protein n=1 Tax=Aquimarina litoralis TaxID=584605 RepID=A0ABN1IQS0_9FLAO
MTTLLLHEDLSIDTKERSNTYSITTSVFIKSSEEPIENNIKSTVRKTFIQKDQIGHLFSVEVLERIQSNKEGIFSLEDKLNIIQHKLVLYTDQKGEIISIVNRGEIAEAWYDQQKILQKTFENDIEDIHVILEGIHQIIHDENEFLSLVKKSDIITLLFPPIYQQHITSEVSISQRKIFADFFDTTDLPFKVDTKVIAIHEVTKGYQIVRSGSLDTQLFDNEMATSLLGNLFKVHPYNINIDANYFEAQDLKENGDIEEGIFFLNIEVPEIYSYRQISKLTSM